MLKHSIFHAHLVMMLTLTACQIKPSDLKFNDTAMIAPIVEFDSDYAVNLPIGERGYVASTLRQIFKFAPGDTDASILNSHVFMRSEYGGSCDRYEPSEIMAGTTPAYEFTVLSCSNGVTPAHPPQLNPMRFALTTKLCESLIHHTNGVRLGKLMEYLYPNWTLATSSQSQFIPNEESIKKAYEVFYRLDEPSAEVIQKLLELEPTETPLKRWRYIWTTICISPEWQMY